MSVKVPPVSIPILIPPSTVLVIIFYLDIYLGLWSLAQFQVRHTTWHEDALLWPAKRQECNFNLDEHRCTVAGPFTRGDTSPQLLPSSRSGSDDESSSGGCVIPALTADRILKLGTCHLWLPQSARSPR